MQPFQETGDLLHQVKRPIDRKFRGDGAEYDVTLLGRCRADGMWEGRIRFQPKSGEHVTLNTPVESTQPSERLLIRWAEGLSATYYEGAFRRAIASAERKPLRKITKNAGSTTRIDPARVEKRVLDCFGTFGASTLNRQAVLDAIDEYAHADVIRAIESLERKRKVVRFTDRGSLWVALARAGTKSGGKRGTTGDRAPELIYEHPHPIRTYEVIVLGVERSDGTWSGWLQFHDTKTNQTLRTGQETSQPKRADLEYWASGLEDVYFEGAVRRAKPVKETRPTARAASASRR